MKIEDTTINLFLNMKQRIKIKRYKKELSKEIDFVTESFFYWLNHTDLIDSISLKIWHEYFKDLETLEKLLKNKQLRIIKDLMYDAYTFEFKNLLDDIDAVFEVAFDDKEIYNYSDLLRKPILKPTKQNKRKQYQKHLTHILSIYKKRINKISDTIAFKNLYQDIENITKLIQQNRIKELNSILNDMLFKSFVEDLVNWYLYDFDDNNNAVYDINLHNIR